MILTKNIILGSAKFGHNYGIFNNSKSINLENLHRLIKLAKQYGINFIDTSKDYKNSENIIGKLNIKNFNIITKIPKIIKTTQTPKDFIKLSLNESLLKLKARKLYGVLFRSPTYLIKEPYLSFWHEAKKLKEKNLIKKIGITLYNPEDLDVVYEKLKPDIVQFPYNIFDQRFKKTGWIDTLYDNKVELHARSIFLQGLLLIEKSRLPDRFLEFKSDWSYYHSWLKKSNTSALEACVNFIMAEKKISKIILGIDTAEQLLEIINVKFKNIIFSTWKKNIDERVYNPLKW